jgi:hypothetical protein
MGLRFIYLDRAIDKEGRYITEVTVGSHIAMPP